MSKLDEAEQRLQRAVAGLEEAAKVVASSAEASVNSSDAPAAPDPQITADLASAQARNAKLEDVNANVAQRLDGTIARLKTILED